MSSRLRRFSHYRGVLWLAGVGAVLALGCKGQSPFLALQFATTLQNIPGRGPSTTSPTTNPGGGNTVIDNVTDLPAEQRNIQVLIRNEAQQFVRFAVTLVASAGTGGFVPDSEVQNYLNAGYTDLLLPGATTTTIGCVTLQLTSGTRLLGVEYGIDQGSVATIPPNTTGDPNSPQVPSFQFTRRDNGSTLVPLPQLMVFGNEDPSFVCLGTSVCSQRGFNYTTAAGILIAGVISTRIQGTLCNEGFAQLPEWQLDTTPDNGTIAPFQFAAGGTIVASVLDRAIDTTTRNQVVWQVTNAAGQTVIFPER